MECFLVLLLLSLRLGEVMRVRTFLTPPTYLPIFLILACADLNLVSFTTGVCVRERERGREREGERERERERGREREGERERERERGREREGFHVILKGR